MRLIAVLLVVLSIVVCGLFIVKSAPTIEKYTSVRTAIVEIGKPLIESTPAKISWCAMGVEELPEAPDLYDREDPRFRGATIVVVKHERRLVLMRGGKIGHDRFNAQADCWRVALGIDPQGRPATGDKLVSGDRRTPEGWYRTSDKPWSQYHHAIQIDYPDEPHAARGVDNHLINKAQYEEIVDAQARDTLPPQETKLGGEILIHGGGSSADWTWGCIALNDNDLEELRAQLPPGLRKWILILP